MLTTRQPIFRRFWHAVLPLSQLQAGPQPFTLLGEPIVLFLDEHGAPAALRDRCCHRTARLSKGRCEAGRLACGYHGWQYDRSGRVVKIPQVDDGRAIPADYRTTAYHCTARHGYAWVALEEPIADIPAMPEFGAPGWRTIFQFHEVWHTSPLRALENSFDNSHFSFVHRATFGVGDQPRPSKYALVDTPDGFHAETVIPAAFQRISGVADAVTTRHMRNAYFLPFSRRLDIEYPSGIRHVILNCFTPIDDGRIQLCQWLFRNDSEADCPAQLPIDFDDAITREDKDILESTDPDALVDTRRRGVEFSMDSDRPGMLIRKKLMELLARHGEREIHAGNQGTPCLSAVYQYDNRAPFVIVGRKDRSVTTDFRSLKGKRIAAAAVESTRRAFPLVARRMNLGAEPFTWVTTDFSQRDNVVVRGDVDGATYFNRSVVPARREREVKA